MALRHIAQCRNASLGLSRCLQLCGACWAAAGAHAASLVVETQDPKEACPRRSRRAQPLGQIARQEVVLGPHGAW